MDRESLSRRSLLVLAWVGTLISLLIMASSPVYADVDEDAHAVYCMSRQASLVDAATTLGLPGTSDKAPRLTVGGKPVEPQEWRKSRPADFGRACAALYAARNPPVSAGATSQSGSTSWLPLLAAIIGFAGASLLARVARAGTLAQQLRIAVESFSDAVREYVAKRGDDRSDASVVANRNSLANLLLLIRTAHPKWHAVSAVHAALTTGELGAEQVDRARLDEFGVTIEGAQIRVLKIARSVGRPLWFHPSMWKSGAGQ